MGWGDTYAKKRVAFFRVRRSARSGSLRLWFPAGRFFALVVPRGEVFVLVVPRVAVLCVGCSAWRGFRVGRFKRGGSFRPSFRTGLWGFLPVAKRRRTGLQLSRGIFQAVFAVTIGAAIVS